ncbi:hypothetical protein GRI40_08520 [Altererythrobacter aerius]|uniref:DUF4440 domain-containing protein n=1 Tax=Tsuneonella aeria TaxID=1837929 RepID=A0A6I4TF63_9SPHN|nr:hypothetical protein [Tsuneonella aeria]MXO75257.1 hypothetical protein [Tsuneonella aeria]
MRRTLTAIAAVLCLAGCATANPHSARELRPAASPSDVIAVELAFARAARETGTWTAFRRFATRDAVWPGPQWENVHQALRGAADPSQPIVWEPDMVWASCDGSFALSTGPATWPDGRRTRFATMWQRQADGEYRWVLDQGFDLEAGYARPEMIPARVAECPEQRARRASPPRRGEAWHSGRSDDGSLAWQTTLAADCRRTMVVTAMRDGAMHEVFRRTSSTPPVAAGAAAARC